MVYENIEFTEGNFCIGPQTGTFCYVDSSDVSNVVLRVKNHLGTLIRSYTFLPTDIFYSDPTVYPYSYVVDVHYVGPRGLSDFYSGAIFYTLERVQVGKYKLPDETYVEYSDMCIIRKWSVNNSNFTLTLENTWTKVSDDVDYFNSFSFAIQFYDLSFANSTTFGTGTINISDSTNLSVGDVLFLGPSTDLDNVAATEYVTISSISGNTLWITRLDGVTPTIYEYVSGDPITYVGNIFVFSNPKPIVIDGYLNNLVGNGYLYILDQNNYCNIIDKDENAKYSGVLASVWNNSSGGLSFVKAANYMTVDINDNYENIKSQVLRVVSKDFHLCAVYSIDSLGNDIYLLQDTVIKLDDTGEESIITWSTYNFIKDTIVPYNFSTNVVPDVIILTGYKHIIINCYVRDQFNNGVLGANAWFSYVGDNSSVMDPSSGYVSTDADGYCYVEFTTGNTYTGVIDFNAKSDMANVVHGSEYTNCKVQLLEYNTVEGTIFLTAKGKIFSESYISQLEKLYEKVYVSCYGNYVFGLGSSGGLGGFIPDYNGGEPFWHSVFNTMTCSIVQQVLEPLVFGSPVYDFNNAVPYCYIYITQASNVRSNVYTTTLAVPSEWWLLSQMSSNRHQLGINTDSITINQYVFIQDARPPFWSEKVSVNTDIWVRLRPLSYSLDISTLVVKVREFNEIQEIDTGFVDVTSYCIITTYDAGGGMSGVDFLYRPLSLFHTASIIYVSIFIKDFAPIPNYLSIEYWFKIVDDYRGPIVYNISPPEYSKNVKLNTPIEFYIRDDEAGLDIDDVEVFINDSLVSFHYEKVSDNNYKISYDTTGKYNYGETVSINVLSFDKSKNRNSSFVFWEISLEDSTGPFVDTTDTFPRRCAKGVDKHLDAVSLQIYAIDGTGLLSNSISIQVDNKTVKDDYVSLLPIVYNKV